jgi:hypothetical protein
VEMEKGRCVWGAGKEGEEMWANRTSRGWVREHENAEVRHVFGKSNGCEAWVGRNRHGSRSGSEKRRSRKARWPRRRLWRRAGQQVRGIAIRKGRGGRNFEIGRARDRVREQAKARERRRKESW